MVSATSWPYAPTFCIGVAPTAPESQKRLGVLAGDNAGFPNGRRPNDDVIDTIVTLVNNRVPLGDNVDRNEVVFRGAFPFFAAPHQPLPAGSTDPTQN